jgi:hypothetical protein
MTLKCSLTLAQTIPFDRCRTRVHPQSKLMTGEMICGVVDTQWARSDDIAASVFLRVHTKVEMRDLERFAKRPVPAVMDQKEKGRARGPAKVEVRAISQNLPEGTADTAAPGGRKRCRVEISRCSYLSHRAALQGSTPHERAALRTWLGYRSLQLPLPSGYRCAKALGIFASSYSTDT